MKLAGYDFEGPFTDASQIKDLPGVYVVLNFGVLDVGESGWNYQAGGQGIGTRLQHHDRKLSWELAIGKGKGRASAWHETLAACDGAFLQKTLEDKCRERGISYNGDKKELCTRLYDAGDAEVVKVMENHLQTLREEMLRGRRIEGICYAVHYEPDGKKRLHIEQDLREYYDPPCGNDNVPPPSSSLVSEYSPQQAGGHLAQ